MVTADLKRALIISHSESYCGNCGHSVDPCWTHHRHTVVGSSDGCGVQWEYLTTDYSGLDIIVQIQRLRPDLVWIGPSPNRDV